MNLRFADVFLIILLIVCIVGVAIYFLNRWAYKKMGDQQSMIDRMRQPTTLYVIDKKKGKAQNANLPKAVLEQMPKYAKFLKIYFVKAKVGTQIMTFMCDKNVFQAIPIKKNVKVEVAGLYIINVKGMKTKKELKEIAKEKKLKEKDKNSKK